MPELNYVVQTNDRIAHAFDIEIVRALVTSDRCFKQLSIIVLGRDEMRHLHKTYKGIPLSTDILTFTDEEGSGDLFICPKNVLLYAYRQRVPFEVRWWHLVIHGLTHLKNLDHETYEEAEFFSKNEKKLWETLFLHIPYLKQWSWDHNYIYHYQGE